MSKKVLVLYYSMYGHVERLAQAVAEGARSIPKTEVTLMRVPELMSDEIAAKAGAKLDQDAPIASPADLVNYDAIIFGAPTRFGNVASQLRNFMDQTGGLWIKGSLAGKVASVFTSTGTGGGRETTCLTFWPVLAHHGMAILPLPYAEVSELAQIGEVHGGTPYGAGTIAGPDGKRLPSDLEIEIARKQGAYVAKFTSRLDQSS